MSKGLRSSDIVCEIETTGRLDFTANVRALSQVEEQQLYKYIEKNLKRGYIRPSTARNSVGMIWVPKKGTSELRPCQNYVPLNRITKRYVHAPPPTQAYRSRILRYRWYAKYDIEEAYFHIKVRESDIYKTAFRTNLGIFECTRMPFGLQNAPGYFQVFIEHVIRKHLGRNATVHLDDILVYANTREELKRTCMEIETALRDAELTINERKTIRECQEVTFCGFTYGNGRCTPVRSDKTITEWPTPSNPSQLRSFLGAMNVMRDHISRYAELASPLYVSTGKKWIWTNEQNRAFLAVKNAASHVIDIHEHDPTKRCTLITDASLFGISAWLTQNGKPTGICSRALTPAEKNYDTYDRELLAITYAMERWFHLLEGSPGIRILTDHKNFEHELKMTITNRRRNRQILFLGMFRITWMYLEGSRNPADPPSRRPDYQTSGHKRGGRAHGR